MRLIENASGPPSPTGKERLKLDMKSLRQVQEHLEHGKRAHAKDLVDELLLEFPHSLAVSVWAFRVYRDIWAANNEVDLVDRSQSVLRIAQSKIDIPVWCQSTILECLFIAPERELGQVVSKVGHTPAECSALRELLKLRQYFFRSDNLRGSGQCGSWRFGLGASQVDDEQVVDLTKLDVASCQISLRMAKAFTLSCAVYCGKIYIQEHAIHSFDIAAASSMRHARLLPLFNAAANAFIKEGLLTRRTVKPPLPAIQYKYGGSFVRAGSVELNALRSILSDSGAGQVVERVVGSAYSPYAREYFAEVSRRPGSWWPAEDTEQNLAALMTNAGWYCLDSRSAAGVLFEWAERYANGIAGSRLILGHSYHLIMLLPLLPSIGGVERYFCGDADVISTLRGQKVVVVSPFADLINTMWRSGTLREFWAMSGMNIRISELIAVASPMSIWPYAPGQSWSQTYRETYHQVESALTAIDGTMLIASCGCYGVPLVHEISARTGVCSIYVGHVANAYFGVYTQALTKYTAKYPGPWVEGKLIDRFPEVQRVDKGRYA